MIAELDLRNKTPQQPLMPKRLKWAVFALVLLVSFVMVLLTATELTLRALEYGYNPAPLEVATIGEEPYWVTNAEFTELFYQGPQKVIPPHNQAAFIPSSKTKRLLLLGGSAASGEPSPDFSIARILEWQLTTIEPETHWEIVNLAFAGANSTVAREIATQSSLYDLDGILVLMGSNEIFGPYGPGTDLTPNDLSRTAVLWNNRFRKTKLGQFKQLTKARVQAESAGTSVVTPASSIVGFTETLIPPQAPVLESVYGQFQTNLAAIERQARRMGIPVFLGEMPVNHVDHPPFHDPMTGMPPSLQEQVRDALQDPESLPSLKRIMEWLEAHPDSAYLNYLAGLQHRRQGNRAAAAAFLQRACDYDHLRLRADSRINAIIRSLWERPGLAWVPVDTVAALTSDSAEGLMGRPHFYDHIHFTFRANFQIASAFAKSILGTGRADRGTIDSLEALRWEEAAEALAFFPYDEWKVLEELRVRLSQLPFTKVQGLARRLEWIHERRDSLEGKAVTSEIRASQQRAYLKAMRSRSEDPVIGLNLVQYLMATERAELARDLMPSLLMKLPDCPETARTGIRLAIALEDLEMAQLALLRLEAIFPEDPDLVGYRKAVFDLES
jgi:tetratricopeptide (TPR) repeat protein